MTHSWRSKLHVTRDAAKLLITCPERGDLMKARLEPRPRHPRALLTLLEGLSLWSGAPLCVALHVDAHYPHGAERTLFGDELWPAESPLVRFELAHRDRQYGRLSGVGDFRALRRGAP